MRRLPWACRKSGLSPEAFSGQIESASKSLDTFVEKRKSFGSRLWEQLHRGTIAGQSDERFGGPRVTPGPDLTQQRDKAQEGIADRLQILAGRRADAELKIANIKLLGVTSSEKEATLAKIAVDAESKRSEIALARSPGGNLLDLYKSTLAVSVEEKAARIEAEHRFTLKGQEAEVEARVLELKKQGLTAEEQTTQETKLRIALLRTKLGSATAEDQPAIQNAISALKQTLPPDTRAPIGIAGEQSKGIYDPNLGEWRQLRPQEQANLRGGQAEAAGKLRADQSQYASDMRGWQTRQADYMRGADYYTPDQLKRPTPPAGYDVDVTTGQVKPRESAPRTGEATKPMTQAEFDAIMAKYWS